MSDKRLAIKGKELIEQAIAKGEVNSLHHAAQRGRISYPTAFEWNKAQTPGSPEKISLKTFSRFLIDGLGLTEEQILEMKVSELFSFVDNSTGEGVKDGQS